MATVISNGGGGVGAAEHPIMSAELGGYSAAIDIPSAYDPGTQSFSAPAGGGSAPPAAQELVATVEEKLETIAQGWVDSGGPGGYQQAVAVEILRRAALMQGDLLRSVRQWSKPGRERALLEMLGVLVGAIHQRDRLLLELRERLNASPY